MTEIRDKSGRFVSGNSGNPGGRPKIPDDVRKETREIFEAATVKAAKKLVELLESKNEKIRLKAIEIIHNRILGMPESVSKIQVSTPEDNKIIFQWINEESDNASNNNSVQSESNTTGNTQGVE